MKLLRQILAGLGAEADRSITLVPSFGAYLTAVKRVEEFSPENIKLDCCGRSIIVTGKNLSVDKYFQGDMIIHGEISGVKIE